MGVHRAGPTNRRTTGSARGNADAAVDWMSRRTGGARFPLDGPWFAGAVVLWPHSDRIHE